ncbi:MAG: NifB/NifX family molybdenum-iron cluster-binding protein [Mariniphaga sp.]|nr:NifB/NifX family molybdenum-iron cluster-binding protein [Mariniphaga sp.]MDD4226741.1 NifB/NifX family molybdenum-iron cluster-binding protein [Mariniphaga sp.]
MKNKIAIPVDNSGKLDPHFGHCKYFAIHEVEDKIIVTDEIVQPPPHEPGVLPNWLADLGITEVLAGGMGNRAIQHFNKLGINVFTGAPEMDARELINGFLNDTIEFSANYCDH